MIHQDTRRTDATAASGNRDAIDGPAEAFLAGFHQLMNCVPDGLLLADSASRILLVNDQLSRLFGYAPDELIGETFDRLIPSALREAHARHFADYLANPRQRNMAEATTLYGLRKTRELVPVEISLSFHRHSAGLWVTAAIRSVADRRRHEHELSARTHHQERIATFNKQAMLVRDSHELFRLALGHFQECIHAAAATLWELELHGAQQLVICRAAVGENVSPVGQRLAICSGVVEPDLPLAPEPFQLVLADDAPPFIIEHKVSTRSASRLSTTRYSRALYAGLRSQSGSQGLIELLFAADEDLARPDASFISGLGQSLAGALDRLRLEQRQRQQDLSRAEQLANIGRLAAGMAHELRNPLTSIKGLVQLNLREAADSFFPTDDLAIIEQEVLRMERTLQVFLDFARPPKPSRQRIDLGEPIRHVVQLTQLRLKKQRIDLRLEIPPTPIWIDGDSDLLRQLVLNLVLNALDVMPQQGTLTISLEIDVDQAMIRVADTGPGISSEIWPRLFEPFMSDKQTGVGLGLAESRRIAEDHGGSLHATNLSGGGAMFTLRVPLPALSS